MNTDTILDFLVDYYIWFIVGGLIILVAIIGFVADKKNLFPGANKETKPKKEKPKKQKKEKKKKDASDIWDLDANEENNESDNNIENDNITATMDSSTENIGQEHETENMDNDVDLGDTEIESKSEEYAGQENESLNSEEVPNIQDSYDDSAKDATSMSPLSDDSYYDTNQIDKYEQSPVSNDTDNMTNVEQIKNIEQDIDKIDNMFASNNDETSIDEKETPKNSDDYKNIGDDPNQTLQVNYSQLKEMVEDIIAETQSEHYKGDKVKTDETVSDTSLSPTNVEGIKDIPLPNLDHIAVDTIKQQDEDEDEDDVWKF